MRSNTTDFKKTHIIKQYAKGTLIRYHLDIPESLRMLGNIKNKKILDLGCGDGRFSNTLYELGANCTGADVSPAMIKVALTNYPHVSFIHTNTNLKELRNNSFDKIILRNVLLNISNKITFNKIFQNCARVLKPGGEIIFSNPHPASIKNHKDNIWEVQLPKNGVYLKSGMTYHIKVLLSDFKSWMEFDCCQWPIEDIFKALSSNNFRLCELTTPIPNKNKLKNKYLRCFYTTPHLMFFKAIKE